MKRRLFVCFLALTMLLSLTACGAASKTAASSANSRPADTVSATEEKGYFDAETNGGYDDEGRDSGGSVLENQKIIYTGDINLETTAFDETVKALAALAEVKGGYLESSTVGGGSRGYRWADYTFVALHPARTTCKTAILYGAKDDLTGLSDMQAFVKENDCELTVSGVSAHWFHTNDDLAVFDAWLKNQTARVAG